MAFIFLAAVVSAASGVSLFFLAVKPLRPFVARAFAATVGFILFAIFGVGLFWVMVDHARTELSGPIASGLAVIVLLISGTGGTLLAVLNRNALC
jgi:hypothetical protein